MKIRRWLASITTVAVLGSIGTVAIATPASASSFGPFRVINVYSGLCVEVPDTTYDYVQLELGYCDDHYNEYFQLFDAGLDWMYYFKPPWNWYCMDVLAWSVAPDAPIFQWGCTQSPNQKFIVHFVSQYERKIENQYSGLCVRTAYNSPGSPLIQGYCNDGNALWFLQQVYP